MIRVLHVIDSLDLGGAQTVILQIAQNLDRSRFTMEVATMHGQGFFTEKLEKEGVRVHSLSSGKHLPVYIPNFLRLIAGQSFDVFHFHLFGSNWIAKPLAALMGNRRLIAHDHCNDIYRSEKPLNVFMDRLTNKVSWKILAVSRSTEKFLLEVEKVRPKKVVYLANGMDTDRFQPFSLEMQKTNREKFGLPEAAFVVGGIGRLHPQKNFSLFLDVAASFRDQPGIIFIIAGSGSEETMLRQKVRDLNLENRVLFAGLVSDMPAFYSCLDTLLLTSRYEGMPMTVLEAMACGIPTVGSDLDGVKEIITDSEDGFLAKPLEAQDFTTKLNLLVSDRNKLSAFGKAAREKIIRNYDIKTMVSTLETLYSEAEVKY